MGMNLMAFTCPSCGQTMSGAAGFGPNSTEIEAPTTAL